MTIARTAAAPCLAILFASFGHNAAVAQPSFTRNCAEPQAQAEINLCARAEHEAADK